MILPGTTLEHLSQVSILQGMSTNMSEAAASLRSVLLGGIPDVAQQPGLPLRLGMKGRIQRVYDGEKCGQ